MILISQDMFISYAHANLRLRFSSFVHAEKKLKKLQTDTNTVQQVVARREVCMERLLRGSIELPTASDLGIEDVDSEPTVGTTLLRHIRPQQALNPSELVNIVKFDQLAIDEVDSDATTDDKEATTPSADHSDTEQTASR